jgi:hypothetical protein
MASPLVYEDHRLYWDEIEGKLRELLPLSPNENYINPEKALEYLRATAGAVINGRWFISYGIGKPWFSDSKVLSENTILRIGAGGSFREVVQALRELATDFNCSTISAGNFFSPDRAKTRRIYAMHGFHPSSDSMILEV